MPPQQPVPAVSAVGGGNHASAPWVHTAACSIAGERPLAFRLLQDPCKKGSGLFLKQEAAPTRGRRRRTCHMDSASHGWRSVATCTLRRQMQRHPACEAESGFSPAPCPALTKREAQGPSRNTGRSKQCPQLAAAAPASSGSQRALPTHQIN